MAGRFDNLTVDEIAELSKLLAPLMTSAARSAVLEAARSIPVQTMRPGTVSAVELTSGIPGRVYVILDGDSAPIPCACLIATPREGQRVMVQLAPPAGAYVVGHIDAPYLPYQIASSTTRPLNPLVGEAIYEFDTANTVQWNGTSWVTLIGFEKGVDGGAVAVNQPGAVAGITTTRSRWVKMGAVVFWWFDLTGTATTNGLAGNGLRITAPFTPDAVYSGSAMPMGSGHVYDSSTGTRYSGEWEWRGGTQFGLVGDWSGGTEWGVAPNIGLANGDVVRGFLQFIYT